MKTNKRFKMVCLVAALSLFSLSAQTTKQEEKKAKEKAVKEQVESGQYKIGVTTAYPQRGRSVMLTSSYSLEIRNDSVFSWLPFYGRAYSIPYGGGDGLTFSAPITKYEIAHKKKGKMQVKVETKNAEDTYLFNIDIFPNGSSSINVSMRNREPISFSGEVELLPLESR